jgi:hypothetical protein
MYPHILLQSQRLYSFLDSWFHLLDETFCSCLTMTKSGKKWRSSPGKSTSGRSGGTQIAPNFDKLFCLWSDGPANVTPQKFYPEISHTVFYTFLTQEKHWLLKRGVQVQRRRKVVLIWSRLTRSRFILNIFSDSCEKISETNTSFLETDFLQTSSQRKMGS